MKSPEIYSSKTSFKQVNANQSMSFDLLDLYDETNTKLRECIRVYTILPKYVKNPDEKNFKADKIVGILRQVNVRLKQEIGPAWKDEWRKKMPFEIKPSSSKDWLLGRASIPVVAIRILKDFGCEQEVGELAKHLEYFCSTTGTVSRIPLELTEDLSWLVAAILCDGHVRKKGFSVSFEVGNKVLVKKFQSLFNKVFLYNGAYKKARVGPRSIKQLYYFQANSKPAVIFLNKFMDVPRGKKSHKIIVPEKVKQSVPVVKRAFLEGVFVTDGGKRQGRLGLSTASMFFRNQLADLLEEFDIKTKKDQWLNKKYNKNYYGLYFNITDSSLFLQACRSLENGTGLG